VKVAALYDIHANLPALEAVLAEIGDVDLVLIGGDTVWGPFPRETMDLLMSLDVPTTWIMGNADRDVFDRVEGTWKEMNDWCADRLTDEQLEFLRSRPATVSIDGVLFCHGSPRNDTDHITLGTPAERILSWCEGLDESLVVCGHTHAQFERFVPPRRIVNAGSVGDPFGDRGAYWAIFGPGIDLRFTPYDVDAAAEAIKATGYGYAATMASNITSVSTAEDAARWFERR
jgi:putative phosphoesterase